MIGPMIGLMLPAVANPEDGTLDTARLLEGARHAEAAGYDGVYVGDHLLHPLPLLESVVTLAAIAASTRRIALGSCVMLAALRDPLWLAKQIGTLDAFAPGRLRLGFGVGGEYPAEFEAAGIDLTARGRRLEQVVRRLRALLAGEVDPAAGGSGPPVRLAPLPNRPIPLLFAGYKEVALRRAAALGDGWIGYLLGVDSFVRRREQLLAYRAEAGGGSFTTGMLLPIHPSTAPDGRAEAAAAWSRMTSNGAALPARLFVAGRPDEIVDQLHDYWRAGCTEMVLALVDQGAAWRDQLVMLSGEVLPKLRAFG